MAHESALRIWLRDFAGERLGGDSDNQTINGRQGTQMKKILLATTAALTLAVGSAGAADLSRPVYKAAPPPPPACAQFGGFYVGAQVGYAKYDHSWSDKDAWAGAV